MENFKKFIKYIVFPSVIVFAILVATKTVDVKPAKDKVETESLQYSEIVTSIMENKISEMSLDTKTGKLVYKFRDTEESETYYLANPEFFHSDVGDFINENNLKNAGDNSKIIKVNYKSGVNVSSLVSIATSLLTIGFMFVIVKRFTNNIGGGKAGTNVKQDSFGFKSRSKSSKDKVKFSDVAGAEEEKEELSEIVDFLKNPTKYSDAGARVPKGVLLVGPPGTGKTLLARAVAGETDVPFFSASGSEFVEMFVGVGASRIRNLFEQAKKVSPSIIFIDEIDAVGGKRDGSRKNGSNEEKEQTLNQLLVEMDGFSKSQNVIVIAATNRPDVLDEALLRPGRFDRQVTVNLPDIKGREQILKIHGKNKKFDANVNFHNVASDIVGFSGADIENLLNESALRAVKNDRKEITVEDINESMIKVMMGAEKKSLVVSYEDKRLTAFHEAGHAITAYFLKTQDEVEQISIIPRGQSAGHTMFKPKNDNSHISKVYLEERLSVMLGGRVAEEVAKQNICSGASDDIKRATAMARKMITEWGMDSEFDIAYKDTMLCSESTKKAIDTRINNLLSVAYRCSKDILIENISKLYKIADILCEQEKMSGEEFRKIMSEN